VGDVIELEAVGSLFGDFFDGKRPLRVASIKSNIGHAEVAAGMFSCLKVPLPRRSTWTQKSFSAPVLAKPARQVIEMMNQRMFLPTAGVTTPRRDFDWEGRHMTLQMEPEPFPTNKRVVIATKSFGIGGSFAHVVFREAPVRSSRYSLSRLAERLGA
jgi:acyl transferase domain-containing protein